MKLRIPSALVVSLWVCVLAVSQSLGAVAVLSPSKDNTIWDDGAGVTSNGSGQFFFTGLTVGDVNRHALIAFDVTSAVPVGATINSVTLELTMSRTAVGNQDYSLHRVVSDWGEGASNAAGNEGPGTAAANGDATWLHTFYNTSFWSTPGGDYVASPSAIVNIGGTGRYVISTGLVADVQAWVDNPATDFGWLIAAVDTINPTAKRFDSRENGVAANRPQLTIDYTPPVLDGACCRGVGVCSFVSEATCDSQAGTFLGAGVPCSPDPCAGGTGACCFDDGSCTTLGAADCHVAGGIYSGDGTTCTPNTCPQPMGACCGDDSSCNLTTSADCATSGGTYQGDDTDCATAGCTWILEPYVDPLPIPNVAQPVSGSVGGTATYEITMSEFQQQVHRDLPPTTFWGYGDASGPSFPGPTIEAKSFLPVTVDWINDLREFDTGSLRTDHYLPVPGTEPMGCIHGAQDLAKTVVHLHGAHVRPEFDGYPEFTFLPGNSEVYVYTNNQRPATLWYHDHSLGITRLNAYMGLSAFYILRDNFENALALPSGAYEIPLMLTDRSFNPDGSLKYPSEWEEVFFGDKILVNGMVWPYLDVDQGKYRFRLLNGSGSRTYTLALSGGLDFTVLGGDGGLLNAPLTMSELTLGPAERMDVVIDFEGLAQGTEIELTNSAPTPYPGTPGIGVVPEVMKFVVGPDPGDTTPVPPILRAVGLIPESQAVQYRDFVMQAAPDPCTGNAWLINGLRWDDIVEYPELGTVEVWRFINRSGMSHPMHMHLVMFQVLDRQPFTIVDGEVVPSGPPVFRPPEEGGFKDTVMAQPGEITRVIARFENYTGKYAYHCHILEHEDQEMMRQFQTIECGNGDEEPTESCDDGNKQSGDGCSEDCDPEERVELVGTAVGGTVDLTVGGVALQVTTTPGQTAAQVAQAMADAINADPTLIDAGITAIVVDGVLYVGGDVKGLLVADAGLTDRFTLTMPKTSLWWTEVQSATAYDVIRGDLPTLKADASFVTSTLECLESARVQNSLVSGADPGVGESFWFLVRTESTGVNGSYDTGGPGQTGPRDAGITGSGNDCP